VHPLDEPISPELALVSPELSALARAGLSDRPWESFLPAGGVVDLVPLEFVLAPRGDIAPVDHVARRSRRRRVPVGPIVLAGFVGLVAVGSVLPTRDAPSLAPPQAHAGNPSPAPDPAPPTATSPPISTDREPPPLPATSPTSPVPPLGPPEATSPTPRGYVFTNGKGFLQVDAAGRTILQLQAVVPCAGTIQLNSIAVGPDGSFHVRRRAARGKGLPLDISGTVASPTRVHGSIRVVRGACRNVGLRFVGRLS
jgi:hypothetical protein